MKRIVAFFLALNGWMYANSQGISFSALMIPDSVKKNANVVTRDESIEFEVQDVDKASMKVHTVMTILNESGKSSAIFREYTSKYSSLDDAEVKVYDAFGKQVSRYKKKDMMTVATGEGLIEDGYVTYLYVPVSGYPVTVEFNYEKKYKGTLNYPSYIVLVPKMGVERSSFTARIKKGVDLRFWNKNINLAPKVAEEGDYKVYNWAVKNLAPVEYEDGASDESNFKAIYIAPNKFNIYGSQGDMSSWKSFGEWMRDLYKGLDELPEDRKAFFRNLVKNAADDREKVKIIYDYLQHNFRYVSIQLGIGGWKPFSASFTDQKKYGDCKALSNYMKAALKAVDIRACVAAINAEYNSEPVDPSFPANRFDHVILCVPRAKDSIWLECTSSTTDFGVLGPFTENRNALLITDQGGVLVPTPKSKPADNRSIITTVMELQEDGGGITRSVFRTSGEYRRMMEYYMTEKKDDQKEFIVHSLGFKQPDEFEYVKDSSADMYTNKLNLSVEKLPEFIAGNKMFFSPRMHKMYDRKLPKAEKRRQDFYFRFPFEQVDTTIIKLPAGFTAEALPQAKNLSSKYSSFSTNYWYDEQKRAIYSTVRLELKQHRIPAADYAEVKKFFDDVMSENSQRIIVKKP